jgi:hypothetical protein
MADESTPIENQGYQVPNAQAARDMAKAITYSSNSGTTRSKRQPAPAPTIPELPYLTLFLQRLYKDAQEREWNLLDTVKYKCHLNSLQFGALCGQDSGLFGPAEPLTFSQQLALLKACKEVGWVDERFSSEPLVLSKQCRFREEEHQYALEYIDREAALEIGLEMLRLGYIKREVERVDEGYSYRFYDAHYRLSLPSPGKLAEAFDNERYKLKPYPYEKQSPAAQG